MNFGVKYFQIDNINSVSIPNDELMNQVEIIDSSGHQIYLGKLKQGPNQINVPKLSKGLYLVVAWGANIVKSEKLIIP